MSNLTVNENHIDNVVWNMARFLVYIGLQVLK